MPAAKKIPIDAHIRDSVRRSVTQDAADKILTSCVNRALRGDREAELIVCRLIASQEQLQVLTIGHVRNIEHNVKVLSKRVQLIESRIEKLRRWTITLNKKIQSNQ